MPLALMTSTSTLARDVLEAAGWETLDAERPQLRPSPEARPVDVWVVGLAVERFAEELGKLAALKAHTPDLRLVVIAPYLEDAAGHCITDVLLDVPIIRCGFERELLCNAVAAA